jgi:hypothetical protein
MWGNSMTQELRWRSIAVIVAATAAAPTFGFAQIIGDQQCKDSQ